MPETKSFDFITLTAQQIGCSEFDVIGWISKLDFADRVHQIVGQAKRDLDQVNWRAKRDFGVTMSYERAAYLNSSYWAEQRSAGFPVGSYFTNDIREAIF